MDPLFMDSRFNRILELMAVSEEFPRMRAGPFYVIHLKQLRPAGCSREPKRGRESVCQASSEPSAPIPSVLAGRGQTSGPPVLIRANRSVSTATKVDLSIDNCPLCQARQSSLKTPICA